MAAKTWAEIKADRERRSGRALEDADGYQRTMVALRMGEAIRSARRGAGLSQEALAEQMGTSQPQIARLEGGRISPNLETLAKVVEATGAQIGIAPSNGSRSVVAVTASLPTATSRDGASTGAIGHRHTATVRKARVRTTEALLKAGATRKGRKDLAEATGLSDRQILERVNRADLMRVKGVGQEYADLLEAAGVDTVKELRRRNASNLLNAMVDINAKELLVRRLPTQSMVERWVDQAKTLDVIVKY